METNNNTNNNFQITNSSSQAFEYNTQAGEISDLVNELKTKDNHYGRLTGRLQYVYFALIPVYIILTTIELFDGYSHQILIKGLCFTTSMGIFAFIFAKYQKEYRTVDYSEPTLVMLKKAAYRYHRFRKETFWALGAVILLDLGLWFEPNIGDKFEFQIIFWIALIISFSIGLIWWHYKYRPLRKKALELIREIENG